MAVEAYFGRAAKSSFLRGRRPALLAQRSAIA
jgi:hypothetical protein